MTRNDPPSERRPRNRLIEIWASHVATVDHRAVVQTVREDGGWSSHYLFMLLMSAGIAVLGLLLSSPAVVIGAMLISPLMGPIIGLGFGLATFDSAELRRSSVALGLGVAVAVLFCAMVVALSPLQTVTDEIAARTRPNLFDLLVALFSGLAGTYAMIRGRHGAIVGVAIATALMPPLAVVGFGLATWNGAVFWGATLLFFTNLMTIAAAAGVLARIYGFAPNLSPQQTGLQATLIIAILVALGVPLAVSLKQIAWETLASRQVNETINRRFGPEARVSDVAIDYDSDPVAIDATVLTPQFIHDADAEVAKALQPLLKRRVKVAIDQFRVGTEQGEADAQAIAAARGAARRNERVADQLALVAGVSPDQVLIDGASNRALVRATRLPGAGLATYRVLERRVAAGATGWDIILIPPSLPFPEIAFEDDEPNAAGRESLSLAMWAARRTGMPIGVASSSDARAEAVLSVFRQSGVEARRVPGASNGVALQWVAPEAVEPSQ